MHNIKPLTRYRLITAIIAVPDISDGEITDGMNEILNAAVMNEESVVIDWRFESSMPSVISSVFAEEGELFNQSEPKN
jgi:hypothetical protein